MNHKIDSEFDYNLAWMRRTVAKYRWYIAIPFCFSIVIGIWLSYAIPKQYDAKTVIGIQPHRVSEVFATPIGGSDILDRAGSISENNIRQIDIEKIIAEFKLYSESRFSEMSLAEKVADMRERITIAVARSRNRDPSLLSITYRGYEPERVRKIVDSLKSYVIARLIDESISDAKKSMTFLDREQMIIRRSLETQEKNLQEYQQSYLKELPDQREPTLRSLDRLQYLLLERSERLSEVKNSLIWVEQQIRDRQANEVTDTHSAENGVTLTHLRAELKRLRAIYTDKHPEVIRLKNQINALTKQPQIRHIDAPLELDVPLMRQFRQLQAEKERLENDIINIKTEIDAHERILEKIPKREQDLAALQRDYRNIQHSYDTIVGQKLRAERWFKLVSDYGLNQFFTIEPAQTPRRPVHPNMPMIFMITIAVGLSISCALIYLLESSRQSLRERIEFDTKLDLPVLAIIPTVPPTQDEKESQEPKEKSPKSKKGHYYRCWV